MPPNERRVLDTPITPETMERIGVMTELPDVGTFDPNGEWIHTYLVWTNHGYDKGNIDAGYLTIERRPGSEGMVELDVVTEIALLDGIGGTTTARIRCHNDNLTSPESWTLDSTFTGPSGEDLPDQNTAQVATVSEGQVTVTIGDRPSTTSVKGPMTGDWCLFDAVQRLPQDETTRLSCTVLERMLALKRDQSIWLPSQEPVTAAGHELIRFTRTGTATLPTDYWLDERGRLVLVVAYNMVYLLSDTAIDTYQDNLTRQRAQATKGSAK
jgi:hypothetical protein